SSLPFSALSLSRQRLDEVLLSRANEAGAKVVCGHSVESLHRQGTVWQAHLDTGECIDGTNAFLATGKHDLRGWKRPPGRQNDLIAFKMHWRLTDANASDIKQHVELVLFAGGYCGLQPIEDGIVNLCLLVRRETFRKLGGSWTLLIEKIKANSPH